MSDLRVFKKYFDIDNSCPSYFIFRSEPTMKDESHGSLWNFLAQGRMHHWKPPIYPRKTRDTAGSPKIGMECRPLTSRPMLFVLTTMRVSMTFILKNTLCPGLGGAHESLPTHLTHKSLLLVVPPSCMSSTYGVGLHGNPACLSSPPLLSSSYIGVRMWTGRA